MVCYTRGMSLADLGLIGNASRAHAARRRDRGPAAALRLGADFRRSTTTAASSRSGPAMPAGCAALLATNVPRRRTGGPFRAGLRAAVRQWDRSFRPTLVHRGRYGTPRIRGCDRSGWSKADKEAGRTTSAIAAPRKCGHHQRAAVLDGEPFALTERKHLSSPGGAVERRWSRCASAQRTIAYWRMWVKHWRPVDLPGGSDPLGAGKLHCFEDTRVIVAAHGRSRSRRAGPHYRYCCGTPTMPSA
jgi:hypothetical protein